MIDLTRRQAEQLARFVTENHARIPNGLTLSVRDGRTWVEAKDARRPLRTWLRATRKS